jgi:hypothetical protein
VQAALDRVTRLVGVALDVATVSVSVVDSRGRFRASSFGAVEPIALLLSHAFQEHVLAADDMFVVDDGPHDPRVVGVPAVRDRTVQACVGTRLPHGRVTGTLLVMDRLPRHWTAPQLAVVASGATLIARAADRGAAVISGVGHRRDLFRAFRRDGSFQPGGGETTGDRPRFASDPPVRGDAAGLWQRRYAPAFASPPSSSDE